MEVDMPSNVNTHIITMYENNVLKEKKPASEFPEELRYIKSISEQTNTEKTPVGRIDVLLVDADGELTTSDKAIEILIQYYGVDGTPLQHTTMKK